MYEPYNAAPGAQAPDRCSSSRDQRERAARHMAQTYYTRAVQAVQAQPRVIDWAELRRQCVLINLEAMELYRHWLRLPGDRRWM